ncbi:hypothetical protein [Phycicoccus sp.]|uniref:hypothetical protein n=1 Tax=Phycicoccus sp. TaxID=1902410 RepID=UPI002C6257AE|nr:hypothetical protein [Phycicoccus sp.]HMM94021.1 hypothetical protein [Phycicoccus sp.]
MTAAQGWDDLLDPFTFLGNAAAKVATDAWTACMLALWNAGLWLLRLVLGWVDTFLSPDLRESGPMAGTYRVTFWVAATLVVALTLVQTGIAAARRDGRSIARVLVGGAQFVMVWAVWISYAIALLYACSGLTKTLMKATMGVDTWAEWNPWGTVEAEDLTDATIATVLGILGCLVIIAAIGHLMVMLARAAALIVLVATAPIAAAGLASEVGQSWFWKSVRWTHAAAFTPPLMALVIGAGTQTTTATVTGPQAGLASAVGTAVPGVMLVLISCFAPLALFKLLAFVDPGTSSGAAIRNGLAAAGGVQGLLSGSSTAAPQTASSTDAMGRSAPESTGEDATTSRFAQTASGMLGAAGRVLGAAASIGATGAAVSADMTNQMGVGHHSYIPDFTRPSRPGTNRPDAPDTRGEDQPSTDGPDVAAPDAVAPLRPLPTPAPAAAAPAGAAGAAGAGAGAGVAAAVPVVPV